MRSSFTPEETDAILAKHYPWALEAKPMKVTVQAQNLKVGDVFDSGEVVIRVIQNESHFGANVVSAVLEKDNIQRAPLFSKYTFITVARPHENHC